MNGRSLYKSALKVLIGTVQYGRCSGFERLLPKLKGYWRQSLPTEYDHVSAAQSNTYVAVTLGRWCDQIIQRFNNIQYWSDDTRMERGYVWEA